MSGVAYVNGQYISMSNAAVHIEDRGFQFGDGVYEVWFYLNGTFTDFPGHLTRLRRSLSEIGMAMPMSDPALTQVLKQVVRRNRLKEGFVYLQVSRGSAPRNHQFPNPAVRQTLVITTRSAPLAKNDALAEIGVGVITGPEERWARCDIKTVNLLPNVLAKEAARSAGAFETWFVDGAGLITEGASTNAWIVNHDNTVLTRPLDQHILAGITRDTVIGIIKDLGYTVEEAEFSPDDVGKAREAFLTSATAQLLPVVTLDGRPIGNGEPGLVTRAIRKSYLDLWQ